MIEPSSHVFEGDRPVPGEGRIPPFSALVAAWNEADNIKAHIASFKALGWHHCELIVCAGGSDDTFRLALTEAAHNVNVLPQRPLQGKQAALRECLKLAKHDLIYLTDADCLFDAQSLHHVFEPIVHQGYQVATGGSQPLESQRDVPLVQYQECRDNFYHQHRSREVDGVLGRNVALTRSCLRQTGGFEAEIATGTDYHLGKTLRSLDVPIAFAQQSLIASEYPSTPRSYVSMWRRWVKNLIIHDPGVHWRTFAKSVILAIALLMLPLSWLITPWQIALAASLLFVLPLRSRYRDLIYCRRQGRSIKPATFLLAPYFLVLDQLAVLGALYDLLRRSRREQW